MRFIMVVIICIVLSACAKPQIVEQKFPPEKTLHMSRISEVTDHANLNRYVFYLNQGETVPLKLQMNCSLIDFDKPQVNLVLKKKIFFRIDMAENTSKADLEKILKMTPEKMANLKPSEMKVLLGKVKIYISRDGITWAFLMDKDGVKQVLGLERGEFSLGMALSDTEGMWFLFSLVMYERDAV